MNIIFFALIAIAYAWTAWMQVTSVGLDIAPMQALSLALLQGASDAVTLAIGLVGAMTLFLGLMKVVEEAGLLRVVARALHPILRRLFPEVPAEHPAMGAMVMNLSANALGLGNAATPFGIRAMQGLESLNPNPGTATDAMVLFLAINTSSVTLIPTGVIALRATLGSTDPAGILLPTLFASTCSTIAAILLAKGLRRFFPVPGSGLSVAATTPTSWLFWIGIGMFCSCMGLALCYGPALSPWILPSLVLGFLSIGVIRKVAVYHTFIEGAKEGFQVAARIIPYLVAILTAIAMLRTSGALDALIGLLAPLTERIGLPAEALPMALMRPLSGSGAYAILAATIQDPNIGPDSYVGYLVSTLQGSSETTFYVLSVYFGAIQIKRMRHAVWAAIGADIAGIVGAVIAVSWLFK